MRTSGWLLLVLASVPLRGHGLMAPRARPPWPTPPTPRALLSRREAEPGQGGVGEPTDDDIDLDDVEVVYLEGEEVAQLKGVIADADSGQTSEELAKIVAHWESRQREATNAGLDSEDAAEKAAEAELDKLAEGLFDDAVEEQGQTSESFDLQDPGLSVGDALAQPSFQRGRAVGIDLGTTNSAVAAVVHGKPTILQSDCGQWTTPSVVCYAPDGATTIGQVDPTSLATGTVKFSSIKRLIGRTMRDARAAGEDLTRFGVVQDGSNSRRPLYGDIVLRGSATGPELLPEEVSAEVLKRMLADAKARLSEAALEGSDDGEFCIPRAVVTVPAYFTQRQCDATERAGQLAGLEKVKLLKEPEAAALAYGLEKLDDELVLVFDLGGGTFDVSVLEVGGGVIEVIATAGDAQLGGDDFDAVLARHLASELFGTVDTGLSPQQNHFKSLLPAQRKRLLEVAERTKQTLSANKTAEVHVEGLVEGHDLHTTISQKQFAALCEPILQRLLRPVREVALIAGILLPGDVGTVADLILAASKEDGALRSDPATSVEAGDINALKKAQQGGRKSAKARKKMKQREKTETAAVAKALLRNAPTSEKRGKGAVKLRQFPTGRALSEVVLVGGATRMPVVQQLVRILFGIEPRRTVDPDLAVALGAAIQAGIMDGEVEGLEVFSPFQAAFLRYLAIKRGVQPEEEGGDGGGGEFGVGGGEGEEGLL